MVLHRSVCLRTRIRNCFLDGASDLIESLMLIKRDALQKPYEELDYDKV